MRALAVDQAGAEVVHAWRQRGIEPVLLKGATIARWLYPNEVRPYGDTDLLVAPDRVLEAAEVLGELGYAPLPHHVSLHAHPWVRDVDGAQVDLHAQLYGLHASAEAVWPELEGCTEPTDLAGVSVRMLSTPGRLLHLALHAEQHREEGKPREDLRRALRLEPYEQWERAQRLADRVSGLPTMVAGLELIPEGRALIDRLALLRAARLAGGAAAPLAIGLARLGEARGLRAKASVIADAWRRHGTVRSLRLLSEVPATMARMRRPGG